MIDETEVIMSPSPSPSLPAYITFHLTDRQRNTQDGLVVASAILSLVGSIILLFLLRHDRQRRHSLSLDPFERFLGIMAIVDIVTSIRHIVSPWLFTPEPSLSCTISGAGFLLNFIVPSYNAALALYFLCSIRYQMSPRTFARRLEPVCHFFCQTVTWVVLIHGLATQSFNPTDERNCNYGPWPPKCLEQDTTTTTTICTRGRTTGLVFFHVFLPTMVIILILLVVCTGLTVEYVFQLERRNNRWRRDHHDRASLAKTQQVAVQGSLYVLVFCVSQSIPVLVIFNDDLRDPARYIGFHIWSSIVYQSQGFFNLLVYIRPRCRQYRKQLLLVQRSGGPPTSTTPCGSTSITTAAVLLAGQSTTMTGTSSTPQQQQQQQPPPDDNHDDDDDADEEEDQQRKQQPQLQEDPTQDVDVSETTTTTTTNWERG
jgi:hypothetical protein